MSLSVTTAVAYFHTVNKEWSWIKSLAGKGQQTNRGSHIYFITLQIVYKLAIVYPELELEWTALEGVEKTISITARWQGVPRIALRKSAWIRVINFIATSYQDFIKWQQQIYLCCSQFPQSEWSLVRSVEMRVKKIWQIKVFLAEL